MSTSVNTFEETYLFDASLKGDITNDFHGVNDDDNINTKNENCLPLQRRDSLDVSIAVKEAESFFEDDNSNLTRIPEHSNELELDSTSNNESEDFPRTDFNENHITQASRFLNKNKLKQTNSLPVIKDSLPTIYDNEMVTDNFTDNIDDISYTNHNKMTYMNDSIETLSKSNQNGIVKISHNLNKTDDNKVQLRIRSNKTSRSNNTAWRNSENLHEIKSLQEKYSKAVQDFKSLRTYYSENMERNLQRTNDNFKKLQHYKSVDNLLKASNRIDSNESGGYNGIHNNNHNNNNKFYGNVPLRSKSYMQRYASQDSLNKRHSDIFDEQRLRSGSDSYHRSNQMMYDGNLNFQDLTSNNNFDFKPPFLPGHNHYHNNFNFNALENRHHQSQLRDHAARSNFERYLKGANFSSSNSGINDMKTGIISDETDIGYSGSGSASPRDTDPVIPTDQLSSRSGSTRSHTSRASSALASVDSGVRMSYMAQHNSLVVVAIDFGTTFSGYAFSFTRDSSSIHMMRRWEGGDPGVTNQKTPTTLLLKPDGSFHSFGFGARDYYHDLDANDAKKWLYFDKFKMSLHASEDLHAGLEIKAANGKSYPAIKVFSHALRFFKDHVLQELFNQSTAKLGEEDITWVLTVPAIWRQQAKQFMRTAAYEAGIASPDHPDRLLIALEPEAASIFCRKLRIRDCVIEDDIKAKEGDDSFISEDFQGITQYIVVDCGGGTVDLTVHELDVTQGTLKELHKGTGGPCGATGVDREFEKLLGKIFDKEFIQRFKEKRPASWIDLMIAFEAKKRTAKPDNQTQLNLSLPFSFIDYHKKHKKSTVENAIKKLKNPDIKWSSQGMLRFSADIMKSLFEPVVKDIIGHIKNLLSKSALKHVEYLFLVGGFAESPLLQASIREALEDRVRVIIPNDVGLAILKGAVLFGLDPTVVRVRRSAYTYGVGVLNKYDPEKHDQTKRVVKDGITWCKDIFDRFVLVDESVGIGDRVTRSYAPARSKQKSTVINIYCTERLDVLYTTDKGVTRCGKLRIEMPDVSPEDIPLEKRGKPRELQASMIFGDTEIKVSAVDVLSGRAAKAAIDFLNY